MKLSKTVLLVAALIIIFSLCVHSLSRSLASTGKLLGNELALRGNYLQLKLWRLASTNHPDFDFWNVPFEDKKRSIIMGLPFDTSFKTNFIWQAANSPKRELVIVCSVKSDNVPKSRWTFFLKYPAHAVGYSDGTVGLISPQEFTSLNLNGFVSAANLVTNLELNAVK